MSSETARTSENRQRNGRAGDSRRLGVLAILPGTAAYEVISECLRSLHFESMNARFDSPAPAHDRTLEWVWNKHSLGFGKWLRTSHGVYWITGRPGSGKSTLMKYLVGNGQRLAAEIRRPAPDCIGSSKSDALLTISYFFDFRASSIARSIEGLLRSLLWQLLREHKAPFESIIDVYRDMRKFHSHPAWSRRDLESSFANIIDNIKATEVVVFIDALDEFDGLDRDIAAFLDNLARRGLAHMKFCFASRPYPDFAFQFADCLCLQLHEQTSDDIDQYLHAQLSELRDMLDQDRRRLTARIRAKAEGIFLWVKLVCDEIHRGWRRFETFNELYRRVDQMPTNLPVLYRRIIEDLSDEEREQAYRMLALVTYAKRPLTILEFYYALGYSYEASIRLGHSPCSCALCRNRAGIRDFIASGQLKWPNLVNRAVSCDLHRAMTGRIYAICRGLIDVPFGHPRFLHETVSAFWPEMQCLDLASTNYRNAATSDASLMLAACTEFLASVFEHNWPVFAERELGGGNTRLILTSVSRSASVTPFYVSTTPILDVNVNECRLVLLEYALRHWLSHVRIVTTEIEDTGRLILSRLSGQAFTISSHLVLRLSDCTRNIPPADMVEMAIYLGLEKYVIAEILASFSVPRSMSSRPHSTHHMVRAGRDHLAHGRHLFAAAQLGNSYLATFLLDQFRLANVSQSSKHLFPENRSMCHAQGLTEAPDEYSQFVLHRAIFFGHVTIVELLLRYGADQSAGSKSPNLTQWLELGSTVSLKRESPDAPEPLKIQSLRHMAETKWVCQSLAMPTAGILNISKPDTRFWGPTIASAYQWTNMPLEFAIRCNYNIQHDSFKALLSSFSLGRGHPSLGNALIAAAFHGLNDYVEQLLAYGVDPNFTASSATLCLLGGKHMCSPLISAICNGHFRVVDLILNHGGDPNWVILCPCGPQLCALETALDCWDSTEDGRLFYEHALSYIVCVLYRNGARVREQNRDIFASIFPDVFQDIDDIELQGQINELGRTLEAEHDTAWPPKGVPPRL